MPLQSEFVSLDGLRIHMLRQGERGRPLVLLHGGGSDSASMSWGHLMGPLAATHRVFAPDWPGFGDSDRPDADYSVDYYIGVLGRFLRALDLKRPTLAGVSMGGAVALGFALSEPTVPRALILVDSYGLQERMPAHQLSYLFIRMPLVNELTWALLKRSRALSRAALRSIFHDPDRLPEDLFDEAFAEARKPKAGAAWRRFQKNEALWSRTRTVYMNRLPEVRAPTLIVHGLHDSLVPVGLAKEAHARIPGSRLHVVNAGHWAQREQPQEFVQAVSEFLND